MGRRTGKQQKYTKKDIAPWDTVIQPNLDENPKPNEMWNINPKLKSPYKPMIFLFCLELFNKTGSPFSLTSPTWMILGVLCNVAICKYLSWSFVGCGKILDFGILWIICLEIRFLMIITNEPINVMYMHTAQKILSFLKYL